MVYIFLHSLFFYQNGVILLMLFLQSIFLFVWYSFITSYLLSSVSGHISAPPYNSIFFWPCGVLFEQLFFRPLGVECHAVLRLFGLLAVFLCLGKFSKAQLELRTPSNLRCRQAAKRKQNYSC